MSALGRLVVSLVAETSKFEGDIGKAAHFFNRSMKSLERTAIASASVIGAKIGATASAVALMTRNAINTADELGKAAQKAQVSTEFMSQLSVQAKLSGTSLEGVGKALTKLSVNAADTAKNTGEAREAFAALGISVKDSSGNMKGQKALFEEVIGELNKYRDGTNKAALEVKIFGRSGAELAPLINSYFETKTAAEELGAVLSVTVTKQAEEFNDTLTKAGIAINAIALKSLPSILPRLQNLADLLLDTAKGGDKFLDFGKLAANTFDNLVEVALGTVLAFKIAGSQIGAFFAVIGALWENINLSSLLSSPFGALTQLGKAAVLARTQISTILDEARQEQADAFEGYAETRRKVLEDRQKPAFSRTAASIDEEIRRSRDAPTMRAAADQERLRKLFQTTLEGLEKQIAAEKKLSIVEEFRRRLSEGSLKDLLADQKEILGEKALELQVLKDQDWVNKAIAGSLDQITESERQLNQSRTDAFEASRKSTEAQQFEIGLIGKKAEEVEKLVAVERLRLDFEQQMASLAKSMAEDESGHGFMRRRAEAEAELIENQKKAIELIMKRREAERSWVTGAKKAFDEYQRAAEDLATQTRDLFENAFQRMEDALVQFVKTGKLNFRDLANSIIEDLIRIQIKTQVMPGIFALMERGLGAIIGAVLPSGAPSPGGPEELAALGIRAEGGPVTAGRPYIVGERGPELFMPNVSGSIIPNGGMGGVSVVQYNSFGAGVSRSELAPLLEQNRRITESSIQSSLLRGGSFASAAGKV